MTDIAQILIVLGIVWLIDKILLALFGAKWRMPTEYENAREKRRFPTLGS